LQDDGKILIRALGLILVVVGHIPAASPYLLNCIYAFHMPLFFFLAGFSVSEDKVRRPLSDFLKHCCRHYLIPYLVFFLISLVVWFVGGVMKGAPGSLCRAGFGLMYGNLDSLLVNPVLWFLPAIFSVSVFYRIVRIWLGVWMSAGLFAFTAIVVMALPDPVSAPLPWGMDVACVAGLFYAVGHGLRTLDRIEVRQTDYVCWITLAGTLVVMLVAIWNGKPNLARLQFGNSNILYLLGAFAGVAAVLGWGRLLRSNRVFEWIGRSGMVIFPLHTLFFALITGLGRVVFHLPPQFQFHGFYWVVVYSLVSLALCYPVERLFSRYAPVLIGRMPHSV